MRTYKANSVKSRQGNILKTEINLCYTVYYNTQQKITFKIYYKWTKQPRNIFLYHTIQKEIKEYWENPLPLPPIFNKFRLAAKLLQKGVFQ